MSGKTNGTHHAEGIFLETFAGIADSTNETMLIVAKTIKIVSDVDIFEIIVLGANNDSIDSKVTASEIFLKRLAPSDDIGAAEVGIRTFGTKGGDFV